MSMKLPFFNNKKRKKDPSDLVSVPNHVAIIMDGNERWAKEQGLPRHCGHNKGMDVVTEIVKSTPNSNVKIMTLYAFSTENWKRPKSEVEFLMKLPKEFLHTYLPDLIKNNVKINTIGEFNSLPSLTREAIQYAKDKTKDNDGLL